MNLRQHLDASDLKIGDTTIVELENFASTLNEWNRIHNLTGARSMDAIYENIIDSIYPMKFIDEPKSLLDVGTGAGFPGMALAIVYKECQTTLCEPLNKRASFLRYVSMELGLESVTVAKCRVEELHTEPFGLITSRAVTDTKLLLDITSKVSDDDTQYLFYKGSHLEDEISSFDNQLNYDIVQRDKRNYLWIK